MTTKTTPAVVDGNNNPTAHACRRVAMKRARPITILGAGLLISSMLLPYAAAADCISLATSTACPAFANSKISTSDALTTNYPFLRFVSNTSDFDARFVDYVNNEYVTFKYGSLFGCGNIPLPDTSGYYARFTETVLCSRMIQDSISACGLTAETAAPVCADTCANFARSMQIIVSNPDTCSSRNSDAYGIIRSDFTICSNFEGSLDKSCVKGFDNESENCGYSDNLLGLCLYCEETSPTTTDTCCYNSNAESRCVGLDLPTFTDLPPITTTTSSTSTPQASTGASSGPVLNGGVIAGITIGALVAVGLIVFALLFCWKRRKYGNQPSVFNHPIRTQPSMAFTTVGPVQGYEVLPGGRVARMSALEEGQVATPPPRAHISNVSRGIAEGSSSSDFGLEDSPKPKSHTPRHRSMTPRSMTPRPRPRNASLSGTSIMTDAASHMNLSDKARSIQELSISGPQSEQLPYFKDYYSAEDIHPGDRVATLWAYSPRAPDEFELDRGDMIKVVGIWDDGWATGIFLQDRAEDVICRREMRDSGLSANTSRRPHSSPQGNGDVKAFPLVCVCLPDHWQKTIENEVQQLSEGDFNSGSENGFASSTTHSYKSSKEKGTRSQPSGSSP